MCVTCAKNPATEGSVACEDCREKKRIALANFRARSKKWKVLKAKVKQVVKDCIAEAVSLTEPAPSFVPIAGTNSMKLIALAERVSRLSKLRAALAEAQKPVWYEPKKSEQVSPAPVSTAEQKEKERSDNETR